MSLHTLTEVYSRVHSLTVRARARVRACAHGNQLPVASVRQVTPLRLTTLQI